MAVPWTPSLCLVALSLGAAAPQCESRWPEDFLLPSFAVSMEKDSLFHRAFCFSILLPSRGVGLLIPWVPWPLGARSRSLLLQGLGHAMVRSGSRLCARHCAVAPRHHDAVRTLRPCASTHLCHPRVGLHCFSYGFRLLLLVQPDAYLLGNYVCLVQVLHQPHRILHCEVDALPYDEHLRLPMSHLRHPNA